MHSTAWLMACGSSQTEQWTDLASESKIRKNYLKKL